MSLQGSCQLHPPQTSSISFSINRKPCSLRRQIQSPQPRSSQVRLVVLIISSFSNSSSVRSIQVPIPSKISLELLVQQVPAIASIGGWPIRSQRNSSACTVKSFTVHRPPQSCTCERSTRREPNRKLSADQASVSMTYSKSRPSILSLLQISSRWLLYQTWLNTILANMIKWVVM